MIFRLYGVVFVCLGIAMVVVTTLHGGGVVGYVLGPMFVILGLLQYRRGS